MQSRVLALKKHLLHPLSPPIVLFMAVALWAAWGLGARPRARNLALLALSAGLYLRLAGTVALLTLLTLATWTWAFGRKMAALPGWGAAVGLAGPVGTLAVFKLLDSVLALPFGRLPAPVGLLVPVGLSFYAFNAVAYLLSSTSAAVELRRRLGLRRRCCCPSSLISLSVRS